MEPSPSAGEETEDARFALFDAFTGFVEERSAERPMLLVLDDLHAADVPSLLLLEFLARDLRRLPVVVLVTMRPEELEPETRDVVARIAREATPLWIAGLDPGEVEALVQLRTGAAQDPRVAEALHEATEGNPFFLGEVVRLLHAEGRLAQPERLREGLPLPAGRAGRRAPPAGADERRLPGGPLHRRRAGQGVHPAGAGGRHRPRGRAGAAAAGLRPPRAGRRRGARRACASPTRCSGRCCWRA